jgi:hypothetical protein
MERGKGSWRLNSIRVGDTLCSAFDSATSERKDDALRIE